MSIQSDFFRRRAVKLRGVVIAGSYQQFKDFCTQNAFNPACDLRYLVNQQQLDTALRGLPIYRVGTWERSAMATHPWLRDRETVLEDRSSAVIER